MHIDSHKSVKLEHGIPLEFLKHLLSCAVAENVCLHFDNQHGN